MPPNFDLVITADTPSLTAELRLLDGDGNQLAYRLTDFKTIAVSRQQGLFDLRNYLKNYVEQGKEAASVAEIGVCIAEEVLGKEIFLKLWQATNQRTLRIQLPGATEEENHLAAALARVPWEIARPAADKPTLADRHLLVRVVHDMAAPATQPLALGPDEPLRVLFVFAEARGSRPLAARRERRELLRLFETGDLPEAPRRGPLPHPRRHPRAAGGADPGERRLPHRPLERARASQSPGTRQGWRRQRSPLRPGTPRPVWRLHPAALLPQRLPLRRHPPREGLEGLPRRGPGPGAGHEAGAGPGHEGRPAGRTARLHGHRPRVAPGRRPVRGRHAVRRGRRVCPRAGPRVLPRPARPRSAEERRRGADDGPAVAA